MKINKLGSVNPLPLGDTEGGVTSGKSGSLFAADLLRNQENYSQERLNSLLEEITKQGAKLGQAPTYSELKTYRELVRSFIGEAVARMYTRQSQNGWDRQGRQKIYTIIKKVDETLVGMAEDVRQGQERQLDILAKQDAIRGMLVDLYL